MSYLIEQYLNVRSATHPVWVDNGDQLAFLTDITGVPQVWKVPLAGGCPEQLTSFDQRIGALYALPDGQDLLFAMDEGGNEHHQLFRLPLAGGPAQKLIDNPQAMYQYGGVTPDGRLIFASNERDYGHFDLHQLDLASGERKLLLQNEDHYNTPAALSPDGRYLLYNKLQSQSDNALWLLDVTSGASKQVAAGHGPAAYLQPVWKGDSTGFYLLTDQGSELIYLAYYHLAEERLVPIYRADWDLEGLTLSPDGRFLAFTVNADGYSELLVQDLSSGQLVDLPTLPAGVISGNIPGSWSPVGHRLAFCLSSGAKPSDVWLLDLDLGQFQQLTASSTAGIGADGFVEPELARFQSFDGLSVPYWLFRPSAAPAGPLPTVIRIHGGPESQERPAFNPVVQFLVNQGFAVVAPNVRGSTGYGSAYHHLDDLEKRLDSVRDIASLVEHLTQTGVVDPGRLAVMGGSYGGFMTLASITLYPQLWAAAVDIVGIANFETFMAKTSAYRRAHRASEYGSLEQHRQLLRQISPIHQVDRITCPLMVIHGANDPRVPVGEAEQIVRSLRQRAHPVTYLRYEDEGHGLIRLANKLDCYPQVAAFLHRHLSSESKA